MQNSPAAMDYYIMFTRPEAKKLYDQGLPAPATPYSAGLDLAACLRDSDKDKDEIILEAGARAKIPTGIAIQPASPGHACFIYSRSGLGARDGLVVAQGVGLIDPDYTGEIFVFILNTSGERRRIAHGQRIAQLVIQPFRRPAFHEVEKLAGTARGSGGFGHTGK